MSPGEGNGGNLGGGGRRSLESMKSVEEYHKENLDLILNSMSYLEYRSLREISKRSGLTMPKAQIVISNNPSRFERVLVPADQFNHIYNYRKKL